MKIIIWGFPLHSHTHSYIHASWVKAFRSLGHEVHWFHDDDYPVDFDYENCLFITEGYADKNIPIKATSTYFVHVGINPQKYLDKGARFIDIRYNTVSQNDCNYSYDFDNKKVTGVGPCAFYDSNANDNALALTHRKDVEGYEALYLSWATDLLPSEFDPCDIQIEKENNIHFIGSISPTNQGDILPFAKAAKENGVEFIHHDPWRQPLSNEDAKRLVQISYLAPDIRGTGLRQSINGKPDNGCDHKNNGYIPCRVFKNISYGQLGITNSKFVYDLFGGNICYSNSGEELFHLANSRKGDTEFIKHQMEIVKKHHTYVNRCESVLKVLEMK